MSRLSGWRPGIRRPRIRRPGIRPPAIRRPGIRRPATRECAGVSGRRREEAGSAIVEFVVLGMVLLIPLVYLVLTMARLQAGAYAVSMAAREAGRAFVTATDEPNAHERAAAAAGIAFADHGFGPSGSAVTVTCTQSPCLSPSGVVRTDARVVVPLPLVPAFVRGTVPLEVPMSATHVSTVDRFRGKP